MKVICFDLWNTLAHSHGTGASYESVLVERGISQEKIFPFVRDYLMTQRMSYKEMGTALFNYFELSPKEGEFEKLIDLWATDNKSVAWIPGTLEIVRKLRSQGRVVVLVTNSTRPGWDKANEKLRLANEFDYLYVSCDKGHVKPDLQVWSIIQSWFPSILPQDFVMVGDREKDDLETPRKLGWHAIHADDIGSLVKKCGPEPTSLLLDTNHKVDEVELRSFGLNLLDTNVLTFQLTLWKGWKTLDPSKSLIIVPGNGGGLISEKLFRYLPEKWLSRVIRIPAKRIWNPGSEPRAVVNRIFSDKMVLGIRHIILIDNVVASGVTLQTIYDQNQPWIPGAKWHALTWLAQRSASLTGEIDLMAAAYCGSTNRREPIASMSTLTNDNNVLNSFAERNFPKHKARIVKMFKSL